MFRVLSPHVHLRMTSFSLGVSKPDVISVISLNNFHLMNMSSVSLNPSEDVPAATESLGEAKDCYSDSREVWDSESCSCDHTL